MEPGLQLIFVALSALHTTNSILNGSEKRNFNNDTEMIRNGSSSDVKSELTQRIGNVKNRELEGRFTDNEVTKPNPTSLKVRADSILYADAGQAVIVNFEVTNNQYRHIFYRFEAFTEDNTSMVYVTPQSLDALPYNKILVRAEVLPRYNLKESRGLLTFNAKWTSLFEEEVTQGVYYYIGTQKPDSSVPTITYNFNGDCSGHLHPKQCHDKIWKADISIQDSDSGLLYIRSNPVGLVLNKKFIVGTKELVSGYYRANCCQPKVDITAADISGNEDTINIDIEKKWLSTGEITSIVLGSILLLLLVIAIIVCITYFCRRKRRTLSIYPETTRS